MLFLLIPPPLAGEVGALLRAGWGLRSEVSAVSPHPTLPRKRGRDSSLHLLPHLRGRQALLAVVVHGVDQRGEAVLHLRALDLAGGSHRLALLLGIERLRQNAEAFDLLDAAERLIEPCDLAGDQPFDLAVRGQAGEARVGDVVTARP